MPVEINNTSVESALYAFNFIFKVISFCHNFQNTVCDEQKTTVSLPLMIRKAQMVPSGWRPEGMSPG